MQLLFYVSLSKVREKIPDAQKNNHDHRDEEYDFHLIARQLFIEFPSSHTAKYAACRHQNQHKRIKIRYRPGDEG